MREQTIPAGTVVKIGGFPFELTEDAKAESETDVDYALRSRGVSQMTSDAESMGLYDASVVSQQMGEIRRGM